MAPATPTLRQRELAARLRRLRVEAGLSVADVAQQLMISPAKLSRLETAARRPQLRDVRDLCALYGVNDDTVNELLGLARGARERGWWQRYDLIGEADTYTGIEASATSLSNFELQFIPGLFQTEGYTRAVVNAVGPTSFPNASPDNIVKVRNERQQRLLGAEGPDIWVVLDEGALHRPVGGRRVLTEQIDRLIEVTELRNVTLQILPFSVGAHPGLQGSFMIFELAPEVTGDIVFIEGQLGGHFLERPEELKRYRKIFDHLRASAESPAGARERLHQLRQLHN